MAKSATKSFAVDEALKSGWATYKNKWGFIVLLYLLTGVISVLGDWIYQATDGIMAALIYVIILVVNLILQMGLLYVMLQIARGKKAGFGDILTPAGKFVNYFLGLIIVSVITIVGLVLLIIPGIIWAIKYCFVPYLIIDQNLSPMEALKKSGEMTEGNKLNIFIFGIAAFVINLIGILAFGVGLLITGPVTVLAFAKVYDQLKK